MRHLRRPRIQEGALDEAFRPHRRGMTSLTTDRVTVPRARGRRRPHRTTRSRSSSTSTARSSRGGASCCDARERRAATFRNGALPGFLPSTADVRDADWKVAPAPAEIADRRVEITGPVDRKMVINALNSGARVFMADFEDATSPTWDNLLQGQRNLTEALDRTLSLDTGEKSYRLNDDVAVLFTRPRGWHLVERHFAVDGEPISGSLFDFGLYFFRNHARNGRYFYLPKLESHLEARLWNDVFTWARSGSTWSRGRSGRPS